MVEDSILTGKEPFNTENRPQFGTSNTAEGRKAPASFDEAEQMLNRAEAIHETKLRGDLGSSYDSLQNYAGRLAPLIGDQLVSVKQSVQRGVTQVSDYVDENVTPRVQELDRTIHAKPYVFGAITAAVGLAAGVAVTLFVKARQTEEKNLWRHLLDS